MEVDLHAASGEHVREVVGALFAVVAGDDNLVGLDSPGGEVIDHLEDVGIVGDSEIRAHLAVLDISGMDADDYVQIFLEGLEDLHLVVGIEARKDAGSMVVEQQLSAALDVELALDLGFSFKDILFLLLKISFVVKTGFHTILTSPTCLLLSQS